METKKNKQKVFQADKYMFQENNKNATFTSFLYLSC